MQSSKTIGRATKRLTPSPSMVVAVLALIVALSGSAYAAAKINGKNIKSSSITGKQIKNSSLSGADIKNGGIKKSDLGGSSVDAAKIADGSVGSADLADGSVGSADLAPGAVAGYLGSNSGAVNSLPNDVSTFTPVATKTLPAGKYIVNANVGMSYVASDSNFALNSQCRVKSSDNTILDQGQANAEADIFVFVALVAQVNTPMSFALDTTGTTLTVECSAGFDSDGSGVTEAASVSAGNARISAIQVSSIG